MHENYDCMCKSTLTNCWYLELVMDISTDMYGDKNPMQF